MSSQERVVLFNDWRGYTKGETITVNKVVAIALVEQNIGGYANPKKPVEGKPQKMKNKNLKGAAKDKQIKAAPISK